LKTILLSGAIRGEAFCLTPFYTTAIFEDTVPGGKLPPERQRHITVDADGCCIDR
jgi:hypothetical protein